jgi:hypothetical protein
VIAVAALLTVAAACLTAVIAQRLRAAARQIDAALADPPTFESGRTPVQPARLRAGRIYLTDRATNRIAAQLDKQLPPDNWAQLAALYLTPGETTR